MNVNVKQYGKVISDLVRKNIAAGYIQPVDESINAFTCGFIDGVGWVLNRLGEMGIEVPCAELMISKEVTDNGNE